MNINYKATHDDPKMTMCYGDIKLDEFNQDDTDLDWEVKSSVSSDCATMALQTLRQVGKKLIMAKIQEYNEKFKKLEFQEKGTEAKDQTNLPTQLEKSISLEDKSRIQANPQSEKLEDNKKKEIEKAKEAVLKQPNSNTLNISPSNEPQLNSKNIILPESKSQKNSQDISNLNAVPTTNQNTLAKTEVPIVNPSNNAHLEKDKNSPQSSTPPSKVDQSSIQNSEVPKKIQNPQIEDIKSKPEEKKDAKLGSVWNANNYHWEEKNLTPFSKDCIKEALEKLLIILKGNLKASLKVEKLKGDSSINIRKGKKCYLFDFEIDLKLQVTSSSEKTPFAEGSIKIDQFDQSSNEYDMVITMGMKLVDEDDNNRRIGFEINKALKSVKEKIFSK